MKRYSTCIVCRGDRKFPLFRGKKTGHGIPPLSCSPFITHLLTPQHRSAAKLYRSNQNSCPSSFSFSFLGNAASNFSKASGFLSQIKLQRQLHGRFIRIRQLTKNHRHIFQWSARQIIMMKLRSIVPASAFCENWQRMFLSSNAQTAPCCNHESVQSGSADRSVMGSGTNVQLLGVQKRILVIDSSGFPDLACLCFFQAATFPAARLTDYRNT